MSEVRPPAAFLQSEVLRSVAGCPPVRPTLEGMGVEFVEEGSRRGWSELSALAETWCYAYQCMNDSM